MCCRHLRCCALNASRDSCRQLAQLAMTLGVSSDVGIMLCVLVLGLGPVAGSNVLWTSRWTLLTGQGVMLPLRPVSQCLTIGLGPLSGRQAAPGPHSESPMWGVAHRRAVLRPQPVCPTDSDSGQHLTANSMRPTQATLVLLHPLRLVESNHDPSHAPGMCQQTCAAMSGWRRAIRARRDCAHGPMPNIIKWRRNLPLDCSLLKRATPQESAWCSRCS